MSNIGPIMLDIEGTELNDDDIQCITHPACGGLILFSRNFESAQQVQILCNAIRSLKPGILIAVDQEGGRVQRFKQDFTRLPPLGVLGELYATEPDLALVKASNLGELMALEVLSVGCDISFSPVLDLGLKESQIIGDRAFSVKADIITKIASSFIAGMNQAGMAATGKHFPGHGSVIEDSHVAIPVDDRELKTIKNNDMKPFVQLKDEVCGIMPAHIIYPQIDELPAGFSKIWVTNILREQIGFEGVVFSDDLSMKGAEVVGDFKQRAVKAISAGCDMVLVCNNRSQTKIVLEHLKEKQLSELSKLRVAKMLADPALNIGLNQLVQTPRWQSLSDSVAELCNR